MGSWLFSYLLLSSSFVCSLNPIRKIFLPQPLYHYFIILSPLLFTNAHPFRAAHTHALLNMMYSGHAFYRPRVRALDLLGLVARTF